MFQVWRILKSSASITKRELDILYFWGMVYAGIMLALLLVEWTLNVLGLGTLNFVFFFFGAATILLFGLTPINLGRGAAIAAGVAMLQDTDITQGTVKGVVVWVRAVFAVALTFCFVSLLLTVFSFSENPLGFFWVLAGAILIGMASIVRVNKTVQICVLVLALPVLLVGFITNISQITEPVAAIWDDEERVVATTQPTQSAAPTSCGDPLYPAIDSTEWKSFPERSGCALQWTRPKSGGVVEVMINNDSSTAKKWTASDEYGPRYTTPTGVVAFRLIEGDPITVTLEFLR